MKKLLTLLLSLGLVFSLAACTNEPEVEEPAIPFVAATADFNGDFYTGWTNSSYDGDVRTLVFGYGLMTSNPSGEVIDSPLVKEKTVSADLTEWTFELNDDITFHNGEELTASDVKFTYDFYMDTEALGATGGTSSLANYVDSVTVDGNTVTFKLLKVIYTTDVSVFFTFILPEDYITDGADEAGLSYQEFVKANISNPIGYGPYKFVEYAESEYVKLEAFEDFIGNWQGNMPSIKEIIVKVTPTETELDQLLLGEVDLLSRTVQAEQIIPAKEAEHLTTNNYFRHGGGTMVLHTDYEVFSITEVRQAFAYVFNRPKVIELFLGEYGIASQGPYSKNQWMMYDDDEIADGMVGTAAVSRFEASLTDYDILDADGNFDEAANIAKAEELMTQAANKTTGEYANLTGDVDNGFMWKGEPVDIKIAFTAFWADTYHLTWNETYVSQLPFNITLVGLDWPVMYGHWIGDTAEERQYHAFVGGMGYGLKTNPIESYGTDKILEWGNPSDNGPRFSGGSSFTPEEWDQLLMDIENAHPVTGGDEYREMFRTYVEVMNFELPIIPVYSNNYHDLYNANLENFNTNSLWGWADAIQDANWK
jgi:ABC-type transport system substrate-binding protein